MQQTDSVFSYIYARKAPIITYKRKQQPYGCSIPRPLAPVTTISTSSPFTSIPQRASPTELTPVSTDDEKENTEMKNVIPKDTHQPPAIPTIDLDSVPTAEKDIFDLPDDDTNDAQVEIRVASSLHSKTKNKGKNKSKPTNTNPKPMNKKVPTKPPATNSSGARQQKRNTKQQPPSFARTLSAPAPTTTAIKSITPLPITRNMSMLPRLPDTKRRKRNLVSQLKAANGQRPDFSTQPSGNRFRDISSDDDDDDEDDGGLFDSFNQNDEVFTEQQHTNLTTEQGIATESNTYSNNYNERMEQELADLLRTEFGQDELEDPLCTTTLTPSSSSSSSQRGCYVPENTIRAPVTYKRLNSNNNNNARLFSSSDLPLTDLDQEMEKQIQYLLSSDF